jgi:hypothetical protein
MSLEYYLICKRSYDKILANIESIICSFEDITDSEHDMSEISDEYIDIKCNKHFFSERKLAIESLRTQCTNKIYGLCCHDFVEDTIDVSPDRSINIKYCSVCEYTLNDI